MSKYEVKLVNIGEEVDNRIRELEIELKDIRKRNDSLEFAKKHYKSNGFSMICWFSGTEVGTKNRSKMRA